MRVVKFVLALLPVAFFGLFTLIVVGWFAFNLSRGRGNAVLFAEDTLDYWLICTTITFLFSLFYFRLLPYQPAAGAMLTSWWLRYSVSILS